MIERADGVAAAADAGEHGVGQAAFLLLQLLFDLAADDRLEIAHHGGEGVRAHDRPQAIMRVVDAAGPFAEGFVDGVFERAGAGIDGSHLGAQQAHLVHVERLALGVLASHVDDAFHVEQRRRCGGCHAVLTCAGFGDQARFAHLLRQQRLPEHVVDLVCSGVVEVFALEVDFRAAKVGGHALGQVQQAGTAGIFVEKPGQLSVEFGIVFVMLVSFVELVHGVHQGFRDVLPAMNAEASLRCGGIAHGGPFVCGGG